MGEEVEEVEKIWKQLRMWLKIQNTNDSTHWSLDKEKLSGVELVASPLENTPTVPEGAFQNLGWRENH